MAVCGRGEIAVGEPAVAGGMMEVMGGDRR